MYKKGESGNPKGRPKGAQSAHTTRFKAALNKLLEENADKMGLWLEEIDNPKDRFDILSKFVEFIHPKLARSELVGDDGKALYPDKIEIEHVESKNTEQDS